MLATVVFAQETNMNWMLVLIFPILEEQCTFTEKVNKPSHDITTKNRTHGLDLEQKALELYSSLIAECGNKTPKHRFNTNSQKKTRLY